ncbi:MAG: HNH endonuclease [Ignavibacteria bacterium]|nr:HNH endonuclease [Ignavibacteria bacterium]
MGSSSTSSHSGEQNQANPTRERNTTLAGLSFSPDIVETVWRKGDAEPGYETFRKDRCGASMARGAFGKMTEYGWEIDHVVPVTKGGTDDLANLQPLHWENNRHKGDDYPDWTCKRRH